MARSTVSYTNPGLHCLNYDLEITFNRVKMPTLSQADTLRLLIQVHFDQPENRQAAEDFYVPIFLSVAADTIRRYCVGKGQEVSVVEPKLRPGLEGSREFLGVTNEKFREQLGDFRRRVISALALLDK